MRNLKKFTTTKKFKNFLNEKNLTISKNETDIDSNFKSEIPYTIENDEIKINLSDDSPSDHERPTIMIIIDKLKPVNEDLGKFYKQRLQDLFNDYNQVTK